MSTELREQLERAYPIEAVGRSQHPPAGSLWRRGRQRRMWRTITSAVVGTAGLAAIAVIGQQLVWPTTVPYVEDGPDEPTHPVDAVEVEPLEPGVLRSILVGPPPEDPGPDTGGLTMQEDILADGVVTADEYRRAMDATVGCVEAAGYVAHVVEHGGPFDPSIPPGLVLGHTWEAPTHPELDDAGQVGERCRAQWSWQVEQVWIAQIMPSRVEQERAWEEFYACAREHGAVLYDDPPTGRDTPAAMEYVDQCYR